MAGRPDPFFKFTTCVVKSVQVQETEKAQAQARALLAAKRVVAYENRAGLIRDIGVPRKDRHLGKVFSQRERVARGTTEL